MLTTEVIVIGRELLFTAMVISAPAIVTSLVVGLFISILQTLTSIQEQTLTFVPRIVAVSVVMIACLPWTLKILLNFTRRMLQFAVEAGP